MKPASTDEALVYPSPSEETPLAHPVGMTLLVLVGFLAVGIPAQLLNFAFGAWFNSVMVFLAIPYLALRLRGVAPTRVTGATPIRWGDAAFGFALGAANSVGVVAPTQYVMQKVLPESWLKAYDATQIFRNQTPLELVLVVLAVGIAAPVCEEFFFRGYLQQALVQRRGPRWGIVLAAFIFSALHFESVGFVARFELGLLFGLLAYRTQNLWAGIGAHAGNNLVSTGLYFLFKDQSAELEDPPLQSILAMGTLGTATFFVLFYTWSTWRQNHPVSVPEPITRPAWSTGKAIRVWFLATGLAVALLFAVDARGVRVNWVDVSIRIPPETMDTSPEDRAAREALRNVRKRARRGEVPLDEYAALRKRLAQQLKAP